MTNGELIEILMRHPLDMPVNREGSYAPEVGDFSVIEITKIEIEDGEIVIR